MKPTPKPKTVARRMYAAQDLLDDPKLNEFWMTYKEHPATDHWKPVPIALLDLRPEAVEGCVEAMADAIRVSRYDHLNRQTTFAHRECERDARAALSALLRTRKR